VDDDDFVEEDSEPDDEVPEGDASDAEEAVSSVRTARGRLAARKARFNIKAAFVPERRPLKLKVPR
jgi:5,10-methylenetetrahydrofolate reductase